jgi:hypothetical protein
MGREGIGKLVVPVPIWPHLDHLVGTPGIVAQYIHFYPKSDFFGQVMFEVQHFFVETGHQIATDPDKFTPQVRVLKTKLVVRRSSVRNGG